MYRGFMLLIVCGALTLWLPACTMLEKDKDNEREVDSEQEEDGVKVAMEQVPAAARKTLEEQGKGGKWEDIEKRTEGGKTLYEGDVEIAGKSHEIQVAEDGTLISNKIEDEEGEKKEEKDDDKK